MSTSKRIQLLKEKLQLQKHPEGGYFKEVYRSKDSIAESELPDYKGLRSFCTSIYFLLTTKAFSSFHRIKQDETWHFYEGSTIALHTISKEGEHCKILIGPKIDRGEVYQFTVPGGSWFAAEVVSADSYALIGCTVAPGFDFRDFTLGEREALLKQFPQHSLIIRKLTYLL